MKKSEFVESISKDTPQIIISVVYLFSACSYDSLTGSDYKAASPTRAQSSSC